MIRFSAGLVAVAIGVLIGGVATSKLLLVYVAIGLSAAALITLAIGVALKREELFGEQRATAPATAGVSESAPVLAGKNSIQPNGTVDPPVPPVPAAASAAFGKAAAGGAEEGSAGDRLGRPQLDEPAYGQSAGAYQGAYGQGVFGQQGPAARESLSPRETPAARDWSGKDAGSRQPQQGAPGYSAARPGGGQAETDTRPPGRHGGPSRSDTPETDYPWTARAVAAPTAPAPTAGQPDVPPPPAAPASPTAPASPAPGRPSWFERAMRSAGDAEDKDTQGKAESAGTAEDDAPAAAAPKTGADLGTTDAPDGADAPGTEDTSASSGVSGDAATSDDDDWWPRRSWLLDEDDPTAAPAAATDDDPTAASSEASEPGEAAPAAPAPLTSPAPGAAAEPADAALPAPDAAAEPADAALPAPGAAAEPADAESALPAPSRTGDAEAPHRPADSGTPEPDLEPAAPASGDEADATGPGEPPAKRESGQDRVTVVPGVPRYHEENCILIRFMADDDVQKTTVAEATEAGCTPCRACRPG